MFGRSSIFVDRGYLEFFHVAQVFFFKFSGNGGGSGFFFSGAVYDFIVNIGYILKIVNLEVHRTEIFYKGVKKYIGSCMADMGIIVDGRAADKKIYRLFGFFKLYFLAGESVKDFHKCFNFILKN